MPVRGVFFDLYGTLLVYGGMRAAWDAWLDAFHASLGRCELVQSREEFALRCHRFFERPEPPALGNGLTAFERRIQALCAELGLAVEAEALPEIAATSAAAWQRYVRPDPESRPVLQALRRRYRLALISNFDHPPHVHRALGECGLGDAFDTIIVSAEVGVKKPDPEIFRIALERTGVEPENVAHVGDTDEDVQGAIQAGIRPILIRRDGAYALDQPFDFHADGMAPRIATARPTDGIPIIARLSDLDALLEG
jgi:HAD superfamily hydrolase (TIGR01509 family)